MSEELKSIAEIFDKLTPKDKNIIKGLIVSLYDKDETISLLAKELKKKL